MPLLKEREVGSSKPMMSIPRERDQMELECNGLLTLCRSNYVYNQQKQWATSDHEEQMTKHRIPSNWYCRDGFQATDGRSLNATLTEQNSQVQWQLRAKYKPTPSWNGYNWQRRPALPAICCRMSCIHPPSVRLKDSPGHINNPSRLFRDQHFL